MNSTPRFSHFEKGRLRGILMPFDNRRRYGSIPTCRDFVPNYGTQHPLARLCYYIPRILSISKEACRIHNGGDKFRLQVFLVTV
jgi:hypothetical protein